MLFLQGKEGIAFSNFLAISSFLILNNINYKVEENQHTINIHFYFWMKFTMSKMAMYNLYKTDMIFYNKTLSLMKTTTTFVR